MMKYYDCVSQCAVNRFLEPLRSVRQWVSENRDCRRSGLETESDCACMYCVHCRVIVDNKSEFLSLLSRRVHPLMQDSRAKSGKNSNNSLYQHNLVLKKKNVCSLCHHRAFLGSKSSRQLQTWRQSMFKISRSFLPLLCILLLQLLLLFMIRSS